jgi:hypothetical protein
MTQDRMPPHSMMKSVDPEGRLLRIEQKIDSLVGSSHATRQLVESCSSHLTRLLNDNCGPRLTAVERELRALTARLEAIEAKIEANGK